MAEFLSHEWLSTLNDTLASAGAAPLEDPNSTFRVVLEFADVPSTLAHALTFTVDGAGARADLGDHLAANAVIRLSYKDARSLISGTLDSASALREGRLKIRGDLHGLVPLMGWMLASHPR
jgi:putative sterol carrier protein